MIFPRGACLTELGWGQKLFRQCPNTRTNFQKGASLSTFMAHAYCFTSRKLYRILKFLLILLKEPYYYVPGLWTFSPLACWLSACIPPRAECFIMPFRTTENQNIQFKNIMLPFKMSHQQPLDPCGSHILPPRPLTSLKSGKGYEALNAYASPGPHGQQCLVYVQQSHRFYFDTPNDSCH